MAVAIDLYRCTLDELTDHISSPSISNATLERYVKETLKLIEQQKLDDKAEHTTTPRSSRRKSTKSMDNLDLTDTASVTSNTSRSRRRTQSSSRRDRSRHRSSKKMEEDSDLDPEPSTTAPVAGKSASVEYSWMRGLDPKDERSDSSSEDPLLRHDLLKDIDGTDVDALLSDTKESKKSHRSKKKKHRRHKKDRKKKKHRHKSKKKKHRRKGKDTDDDYMMDETDEDYDEDYDSKAFERTVSKWSLSRLNKEEKAMEKLIEAEKQRMSHKSRHRRKSRSPFVDEEDEESGDETDENQLDNMSREQIIAKFNKLTGNSNGSAGARNQDSTTEKEDPSKLYCVCRKPHDGVQPMIQCDYCREWYHLPCIGLTQQGLDDVQHLKFKCPVCNGADINDVNGLAGTPAAKKGTFDSPKSTPNPRDPSTPQSTTQKLTRRKPRRFISDTTDSETDHTQKMAAEKAKVAASQERATKYEKVILELQNRLKESKALKKRTEKEMAERLQKAKGDIDEERKQRITVEQHLENAKVQSESMMKDLSMKIKMQEQKEEELVNKLKKLESNKKKYKDSDRENKKKMKQMREEKEARIGELENEIIPSIRDQLAAEKKKAFTMENQMKLMQQQSATAQQQAQQTISALNHEYVKVQGELNRKMAEDAKLQNLNSQLTHKMDALHVQAQHNHQQWERIAKAKDEKMKALQQRMEQLQQQNNALRATSNLPQINVHTNVGAVPGGNESGSGGNTPRPPSPIKMPSTPSYLKFNDLELEELKMCRELCQKLLDANLFQVDHMARRAQLTQDLFISWVTGVGASPTVVNDLNHSATDPIPQLDPTQHVSMNCIRSLLIEIRKQLESISKDGSHDEMTIKKVSGLLRDFQTASQNYEQKMNEFKHMQHNRLLEQCRTQGAILEMLCVIGTTEKGEPKSEWIKVTVCNFDQSANRTLVRKNDDGTLHHTAVDAATLRVPEDGSSAGHRYKFSANQHVGGDVQNRNGNTMASGAAQIGGITSGALNQSTSSSVGSVVSASGVMNGGNNGNGNVATITSAAMGMAPNMTSATFGGNTGAGGQMNFNGLPTIPGVPQFQANGTVLPPFNDLQANNIRNQHHVTNTINTNNNISINNAPSRDSMVMDQDENARKLKTKNASRKRKREEKTTSKSNKKKRKSSKHQNDDDDDTTDSEDSDDSESDDDTDISSDSEDSDSDNESSSRRSKKNRKRRHKKNKKGKRSSSSRKRRDKKRKSSKEEGHSSSSKKRGRPSKSKNRGGDDDDTRSVRSTSSTASNRKRGRKKRALDGVSKSNGHSPAKKRQKTSHHNGHHNGFSTPSSSTSRSGSKSDYVVLKNGTAAEMEEDPENDKNDSVCRICKHPGDLVCCEGCPSAYHADCVRPRIKKRWLDAFEEWHCPSCAPRFFYVPLKNRKSGEKWPQEKEPLLKDMAAFLGKHPYLVRDFEPDYHPSRKGKEL